MSDHPSMENDVLEGVPTPSGQAALLAEEVEAVIAEDECCYICGKSPCEWYKFGLPAVQELESKINTATAKVDGFVVDNSTGGTHSKQQGMLLLLPDVHL